MFPMIFSGPWWFEYFVSKESHLGLLDWIPEFVLFCRMDTILMNGFWFECRWMVWWLRSEVHLIFRLCHSPMWWPCWTGLFARSAAVTSYCPRFLPESGIWHISTAHWGLSSTWYSSWPKSSRSWTRNQSLNWTRGSQPYSTCYISFRSYKRGVLLLMEQFIRKPVVFL